jgi:isochorismate hydrolase
VYAADACASWDMSLHEAALRTAATRYATVETVEEILKVWSATSAPAQR